jgi:hypothetical protein
MMITYWNEALEWKILCGGRLIRRYKIHIMKYFLSLFMPCVCVYMWILFSATVQRRMYTSSSWSSSRYKRTENFRIALKFIILFLAAVLEFDVFFVEEQEWWQIGLA